MKYFFILLFIGMTVSHVKAETLDIMVLYPQSLADFEDDIGLEVDALINQSNTAMENSDSSTRFNLVHHGVFNVSGADGTSVKFNDVLSRLPKNAELNSLRNIHRPDLTAYLVRSGDACGLAYYPKTGFEQRGSLRRRESAFWGVSVTGLHVGCTLKFTFSHELGHNLGAAHSRAQGSDGYPIATSRGWGVDRSFVTMMAYSSAFSYAPRLQKFSNPSQNNCESMACGTNSDNAKSGTEQVVDGIVKYYSSCYPTSWKPRAGTVCGNNICLSRGAGRGGNGCLKWE